MYSYLRKLFVTVLILNIALLMPFYAGASVFFNDIPAGHWAEAPADALAEAKIMEGISTNEFGGSITLNKFQAARIIGGLIEGKYVPVRIILLSDIRSGQQDFPLIMKLLSANLMDAPNNKFSGNRVLSRYEFAQIIDKTLEFLQAEAISIRNPSKTITVEPNKKELVDQVVNHWQLTEGYNDSWDKDITRYEALEMTANAARIAIPKLRNRFGIVSASGTVPQPVVTPTPYPTFVPTPLPTPYPTPVQPPSIIPTPVQTPVPTRVPVPSPIVTPTPQAIPTRPLPTADSTPPVYLSPIPTARPTLVPVPSPIIPTPIPPVTATPTPPAIIPSVPLPEKTPIITIPSPVPERTPAISVTPVPQIPVPTVVPITQTSDQGNILRSQVTFKPVFNFLYSEGLPPFFTEQRTGISTNLGLSLLVDGSYWLTGLENPILRNMGIVAGIGTLGQYTVDETPAGVPVTPGLPNQYITDVSEIFNGNIGIMYRLYSSDTLEFAGGLDTYLRTTGTTATQVNSYWKASKSYFGIGAKGLTGFRLSERMVIEGSFGLYYVMQNINEPINNPNVPVNPGQPVQTGGSIIDRLGIVVGADGRMDLMQVGNNWLYGNINLGANILLLSGDQTTLRGGVGIGISY